VRKLWPVAALLALVGVAGVGWRVAHRSLPHDFRRGGLELLYDVDVDGAVDETFQRALEDVVQRLREGGVAVTSLAPRPRAATIHAPGLDGERLRAALAGLPVVGEAVPGGATLRLPDDAAARIADAAMQRTARVTHDRIAGMELCLPTVKQAAGRLVVGLPGVNAAALARAKRALALGGRLELREVDRGDALAGAATAAGVHAEVETWSDGVSGRALAGDLPSLERARAALLVPGGLEPLIAPPIDDRSPARLYLVVRRAEVDGEALRRAEAAVDAATGRAELDLTFDDGGAARLAALTRRVIGRRLALVLDGRILAAPLVGSAITGGRLRLPIGGVASRDELSDLAAALAVGPLPARLTLASERVVGPTP
jgi:preprotein translocase subunit SecD